jgi:hypothetical protein
MKYPQQKRRQVATKHQSESPLANLAVAPAQEID